MFLNFYKVSTDGYDINLLYCVSLLGYFYQNGSKKYWY